MARFRKVWLALVVCGLVLGGAVTAWAGGPGNGKGSDHGKAPQAADKAEKAAETEDDAAIAAEVEQAEEIAEVADEFEEQAEAELEAKQAEAAAKLAEAEAIMAEAQAAAKANPKRAEQILAKAEAKAAALRAKAEELTAAAEARATEVRLKVEGAHLVSYFHKAAAKVTGEEKQLYKDLAMLFHQGIWFVNGIELPGGDEVTEPEEATEPESSEEEAAPVPAGIALSELAGMLRTDLAVAEDGTATLKLGGIEITFADGQAVLVNGAAVSEEFLSVLPEELSPEAQFLKDLLLGTVAADAEGNLTVTLAAEPAPAPEEPAEEVSEPATDDTTETTEPVEGTADSAN